MKSLRRTIAVCVVGVFLYLSGPIVAAAWRIGDRCGPRFYPESFHEGLFSTAYEIFHDEQPRIAMGTILYDRPWFYGWQRPPKDRESRRDIIEFARQNRSPILSRLELINQQIENIEHSSE